MNKNINEELSQLNCNIILLQDEKKELRNKLQKETGYCLMVCEKALSENYWNIENSKEWLYRQFKGIRY